MKFIYRLIFRIKERIAIEKHARRAAQVVRQAGNANGLTLNLLVMQANEGSTLAVRAIESLTRELTAQEIHMEFNHKTDTITIQYIGRRS